MRAVCATGWIRARAETRPSAFERLQFGRMVRIGLAWIVAVGCALVLVACAGGNGASPKSTKAVVTLPSAADTPGASEVPPATATARLPGAFGGRELVEARSRAATSPLLVSVTTADQGAYDRITFQFQGDGFPGYRVEYFTPPVLCASGQEVPIAGSAYIKVVFTANAHDNQGAPTLSQIDLSPALPTLAEAKQVCDFEGYVTWALGINAVVDYRVEEHANPSSITVDLAHP
jgi:hypothetical protein